ncbi:MAG: VapC toxin family PIN domain ribonuclease [Anaerolinea sp.]|nr:VapC toxin family PIN domain ribonuclease [Anaerolinea sp.]
MGRRRDGGGSRWQHAGRDAYVGLIADTSALVRIERRRIGNGLAELPRDALVAAITISELQAGAYRAESQVRADRAEAFVQAVIASLTVIPFDTPQALEHARLFDYLRRQGWTIGERDLQIGATALAGGHSLLTGNVREFERLPGLTILHLPL